MKGKTKIDPTCTSNDSEATGGNEEDATHIPDFGVAATQTSNGTAASESDDRPPVSRSEAKRRFSISPESDSDHSKNKTASSAARRKSTSSANSIGLASGEQDSEPRAQSSSSDSTMDENVSRSKKVWKALNGASHEINKETRKVFGFFRNRLRSKRGQRETSVKEIHINPEGFEEKWASRAPSGSSSARASSGSMRFSNSSRESSTLHVVHDMEDEYNPEYS